MFTIQSVSLSVLQSAMSDNVEALRPPSMLRTAFREMPLLSAAVCCVMLSASRVALKERPSVTNISAFVSYSINGPIRTLDGKNYTQSASQGQ